MSTTTELDRVIVDDVTQETLHVFGQGDDAPGEQVQRQTRLGAS